jgi:RNA polymerase sigma-70 factor (ECF subfamily)
MTGTTGWIAGIISFAITATTLTPNLGAENDPLLNSLPPVVLKTVPVSGYGKVDPDTKMIKVVFNKKMTDKSWSFVQIDKKNFPELIGEPSFDAQLHTCSVKVKLKPSTTYVIWLNKGAFQNFKDSDGRSAVPYLLAFRTADKDYLTKKRNAIKAARDWLALLDSAKFADTWQTADEYFKKRVAKSRWVAQMPQLAEKIGKMESRKIRSVLFKDNLPDLPGRAAFILRFSTRYERKPFTLETVVPILGADGVWRVSGYYIK